MFEAGLRSMCRGMRQQPENVQSLLAEMAAIPGVLGMWVTEAEGTVIASRHEGAFELPSPSDFSEVSWLDPGLLVGKRADLGDSYPVMSEGLCRFPTPDRPTYLFVLADRASTDRAIAKDLRLRAGILAAGTAAALGAFLLLGARMRTRRLLTELAVSEERSRRNREWALLGAGLAHETKNPLAFVRGAAQDLVENGSDRDKRVARAQQIVDEVDRVVARMNEFLQYSRPVEPSLADVGLEPVFREVGGLLEADLLPSHGRLEVAPTSISVHADPDMLRRILLNLLVNAARALREGGTIRLSARTEGRDTASIEVQDDGCGIAKADLDRVFQPYYTRAPGGTGLGLAIVRRLVEAHGWRIELESEEGVGTVARILGVDVVPDEQLRENDPHRR